VTTQYLTDERGEKVAVVIPIADYDALMEDVADLACVAERRNEDRISLEEVKKQLIADGLSDSIWSRRTTQPLAAVLLR
jgi:PHD/YefM family antitoxin component YafN of YafNO toxin-antitoxin module